MGQTSNHTLRYPDGTDRPRAAQIKNLADDTDRELAKITTDIGTLVNPDVSTVPVAYYPPRWSPVGQGVAVWRMGRLRILKGVVTYAGGAPSSADERILSVVPADRPGAATIYFGASILYSISENYRASTLGLHLNPDGGIRIQNMRLLSENISTGSWAARLDLMWVV